MPRFNHGMPDHDLLAAARLELLWAARILSAAADATLDKLPDDSHSNLGWDPDRQNLKGRVDAHIHVPTLTLHHGSESLALDGRTLEECVDWLSERFGVKLTLRDYDWPKEPRSGRAVFSADEEWLTRVAHWFTLGTRAMAGMGVLRIWPHHFDLGYFQDKEQDGKSIGGGLTVVDDHYPLPYLYVNPYGLDRPEELPALESGAWTDKWFGAVLTADALGGPDAVDAASSFIRDAMAKCHQVLGLNP